MRIFRKYSSKSSGAQIYEDDGNYTGIQFILEYVKGSSRGSEEPKRFLRKLVEKQVTGAVSATTVYNQGLPKCSVLDEYKSVSNQIYCTGRGEKLYGCIETTFDISYLVSKTELKGNAYCYFR